VVAVTIVSEVSIPSVTAGSDRVVRWCSMLDCAGWVVAPLEFTTTIPPSGTVCCGEPKNFVQTCQGDHAITYCRMRSVCSPPLGFGPGSLSVRRCGSCLSLPFSVGTWGRRAIVAMWCGLSQGSARWM